MTEYKRPQFPSIYREQAQTLTDTEKSLLKVLEEWSFNLESILDRGISITDNVDQVTVSFTSNGTPDTEDAITHTLGKVPSGFRVINKDKAGDIYDSGTAWTATTIYLKTSVASVTATIEVF